MRRPAHSTVEPPLPAAPARIGSPGRSGFSVVLSVAVPVLLGSAAWLAAPAWLRALFHPLQLTESLDLAACILALALSIAVHELGHLTAAYLLGFEITSLALGPFRISRMHRRWTLQVIWRHIFRGAVSAIPRSQLRWRQSMLIVVTAGPLATALLALTALALVFSRNAAFSSPFWQATLQLNLMLLLLALLPTPADAPEASDARLLLMLLRFDAAARNVLLYHLVMQLRIEGRRPRSYPDWIIQRLAVAAARPELEASFALAITEWALDRGDLPSAAAWNHRLGALAAAGSPDVCYSYVAQSACFDLVLKNDTVSAAAKLDRLPLRLLSPKWLRYRSWAVLDVTRGDLDAALGNLRRAVFYRPAAELPYFQYEQMLLEILRRTASENAHSEGTLALARSSAKHHE